MTNDELFEDLKQFINVKIDGVENKLEKKIDGVETKLEKRIDGVESRLSKKIDDLESRLDDIEITQNEILNVVGQDIQDVKSVQQQHEVRISKLETRTA